MHQPDVLCLPRIARRSPFGLIAIFGVLLGATLATPTFGQSDSDLSDATELVERFAQEADPEQLKALASELRELFPDGLPSDLADKLPEGWQDSIRGTASQTASSLAESAERFLDDPSFGAIAAAFSVVGGALLGGLALWIAGRRVVKPVFGLIGAASGGVLGAVLLPASGLGAQLPVSLPPTWVGLGAGALLGIIIALAAYRFALAVVAGFTGAVLALLISVVAVGIQHVPTNDAEPLTAKELLLEGVPVVEDGETVASNDDAGGTQADEPDPDAAGLTAEKARRFVEQVGEHIRTTYWEPTPAIKRSTVIASTFFGLIGGLALGVFMPNRSAALITALAGAGLWMPAGVAVAIGAGAPDTWFVRPPEQWLAAWLVLSVVGMILQMTVGKRKKKKRASED